MPIPAHMELTGNNQGKIDGSCDLAGREGTILIYGEEHGVSMPRDTHSGLPTGKRVHHPLVVTKEFDKSSPKLFQALCAGERFSDVTIKYYRIDPGGKEEHYFTVKLEDAIIVNMEPYFPLTFAQDSDYYKHMEKVGFTYKKIIWTWEPDGIEAQDDWKEPA